MKTNKYPECEKLLAVREESQKLGEFIEWLSSEKGLTLCRYVSIDELEENDPNLDYDYHDVGYFRDYTPIEHLLAEYFYIDLNKVEKERRQILEELQKVNED